METFSPSAFQVVGSDNKENFVSVLSERYRTTKMSINFSDYKKFQTWRYLWLWLARSYKVHLSINKH